MLIRGEATTETDLRGLQDLVGWRESFTLSQILNMTRQLHDQFAKQWLAELLQPVGGKVETQREISGETYCADVSVEPSPTAPVAAFQQLGLLGQMVKHACLVEYFWTPPTQGEIRTSLLKLFEVHNDLYRQANRDKAIPEKKSLHDDELPQLWILTTSASETLLNACGANCQPRSWGPGVYFLAKVLKTQVVVINQLPVTPATLWLRILGRGATQRQAVTELLALTEAELSYYHLLELLIQMGRIYANPD